MTIDPAPLRDRLEARTLVVPDAKEEAEFLRCALLAGYATVQEAIAWADRVIAEEEEPHLSIIEIALATDATDGEMVSKLGAVPGSVDPVRVRRKLLGRLLNILRADPLRGDEVARSLYRLASAGELPEEHFGWEPYALDDSFELVRCGHFGDYSAAVADLQRYLVAHAIRPAA